MPAFASRFRSLCLFLKCSVGPMNDTVMPRSTHCAAGACRRAGGRVGKWEQAGTWASGSRMARGQVGAGGRVGMSQGPACVSGVVE